MRSLPRYSLHHPAIIIVFALTAITLGLIAFFNAPRRSDPDFTLRRIRIVTEWPGVQAERVERLVTDPIERALAEIERIEHVTSTSTTGLSVVTAQTYDEPSSDEVPEVWDQVREKVRNLADRLPESSRTPIVNSDFGDTAMLLIAVYSKGGLDPEAGKVYTPRELRIFAERLRDRMLIDPDVSRADLHGDRQERIYLETSPGFWSQFDLTIPQLQSALSARNIRIAGGSLDLDQLRVGVQPSGEFENTDQIIGTIIGRTAGGTPIRLSDVGVTLRRDYADPPRFLVRFATPEGAAAAVIVAIVMHDDAQVTRVGPRLQDLITTMQDRERVLPPDLGTAIVFNEADFIEGKIDGFLVNLAEAVAIVIVVALVLAGIRSSLVIALAIPFIMITAFGIAWQFGVVLEQMSIASLIIALGLMVDNAVVVCDNTRRYMNMGLPADDATATGVEEIMRPTLMGTLTTIFVFLPMGLVLNGAGAEYIFSIPVVVSLTLIISWLAATTLTTLMARWLIRPSRKNHRQQDHPPHRGRMKRLARRMHLPVHLPSKADLQHGYDRVIRAAVRAKWITAGLAILAATGSLFLPIGSQFFPDDRRDQFYIDVWLPEGASIEATRDVAVQVERAVFREAAELAETSPDVVDDQSNAVLHSYVSIGGSGPRFTLGVDPVPPAANFAQFIVTTATPEAADQLVTTLTRVFRTEVAGARVIPRRFSLGPPVATPIGIRLAGVGLDDPGFADMSELRRDADRILSILESVPGTWDHHLSWGNIASELQVKIDEEAANAAGVSNAAVADTLAAYLSGRPLTTFREGDLEIPVVFRLPPTQRSLDLHPDQLYVEGSRGKVPLSTVADVGLEPANVRIERRDNRRMIEIRARTESGYLANERLELARDRLERLRQQLPPGTSLEYGGELEEANDAQRQIATAFGIGFALVVLVLVVQYNSIVKPLLVLTTLPMGLIGALVGLWLSGEALGFMPMLGLVALSGMVVNSAILYIEFADSRMREKLGEAREARSPSSPAAKDATEESHAAEAPSPSAASEEQDDQRGQRVAGGLTRQTFRDCLAEAGHIRLVPILLTSLTTIGGFVPLLFAGPLWKGLAAVMIGGLASATLLTLIVLPAAYAILVERLRYRPVSAPSGESND